MAATGWSPPEAREAPTADGAVKSEKKVRLLEPALSATRSNPDRASKLPTKAWRGESPVLKTKGVWSLKKPPPTPGNRKTLLDRLLTTNRSLTPSPVTSC